MGAGLSWTAAVAVWPNGRTEAVAWAPGRPALDRQERRDKVPAGFYTELAAAGALRVDGDLAVPRASVVIGELLLPLAPGRDPPPLPSLEERYRERFPTNAGDVDGPRWSPAKELMEEHQALQGLGRRSKLDREYHDCFQRLDSSLFTHHRWPVKDDPSLPHCLLDTHDSPPANEAADPLRAIDQYERSLPTAYGSDWRELDIPGRARKAVEKVVNSVANYFRTEVQEQEAQTAAVREECATDARAFHEAMLEDRRARQLTLDIVDRIHELRYWEREQARREEQADRSPQQSAPQYTPPVTAATEVSSAEFLAASSGLVCGRGPRRWVPPRPVAGWRSRRRGVGGTRSLPWGGPRHRERRGRGCRPQSSISRRSLMVGGSTTGGRL